MLAFQNRPGRPEARGENGGEVPGRRGHVSGAGRKPEADVDFGGPHGETCGGCLEWKGSGVGETLAERGGGGAVRDGGGGGAV